ncbi:MAG: hypothetical protein Q9157_005134 [Trypethelium eluteriae]
MRGSRAPALVKKIIRSEQPDWRVQSYTQIMADFDDSDWSDDVSESDAQRSNYPFPLDRFTLNIRGPQLSLEEFKAELHRITRNSTEDELCEIHGKLEKPGTRFLHLGARNGVDYGMMNGLDGRFIMTGEHHKGELNFDVHSSATLAAFFIDELKTQEILMRPVGEDEPYVSSRSFQIHQVEMILKIF